MAKKTKKKANKKAANLSPPEDVLRRAESREKITVDKKAAAERVKKLYPILAKQYPKATTALRYGNPLELLIATILSAQCTDTRVNMVTLALFKKYKGVKDWAKADLVEIENDIKSTGFFRNKAVSI